jgi:hypothetical protein
MGVTRAHHIVGAYNLLVNKRTKIHLEAYYQNLYDIPVENDPSSFSLVNQGSGFDRFFPGVLVNTGTGVNKGVEATIERSFYKNYFLLATGSLFDSKYRGSDMILRNSDFNGRFATNLLAGYEKPYKNKNNTFSMGSKITWAGGRRYSPIDTLATRLTGNEVVFDNGKRNTLQFKNYFRFDIRFGFRWNRKKMTQELMFDIVNVLDIKNVLGLTYVDDPDNPGTKHIVEEYQLGRLPIFSYKLEF